ncbi:MAG TPA: pseudouridine synthase, partial [Usitatibacter sp.]|nr:pseudouridine synthase [Usitatibacter sp.]
KRVSVSDQGQAAETVFRRISRGADASLLEAELLTGRTHQIRVHLAHLGHPVLGDEKYGDFDLNKRLPKEGLKRMFLHAAKLSFVHPMTEKPLEIVSPLPKDLATFAERAAKT